ncbi:hypothetical protein M0R72_08215 [Candidatus Pacearchaeota archaeon]|nr:hypothetical protein [Candidatus Pacearchaeota archaeon]
MECKICERERPMKYFPKRIVGGTGQVLRVCSDCDNSDITNLAEAVAQKLDVDVDCSAYLQVRRR